jgi:hypothetical protein
MVHLATQWAQTGLVVIDRLWLSELVYGTVYRGGPSYDVAARCLDRVLQRFGAITVLCVPDDTERQARHHAELKTVRHEAFDKIEGVIELYRDLASYEPAAKRPAGLPYLRQLVHAQYVDRPDVVLYDFHEIMDGETSLENEAAKILRQLQEYRARRPLGASDVARYNLAGHPGFATHVLVGDSLSPRVQRHPRWPQWPWCWSEELSSATWLNRALHALGTPESSLVFTNAQEPDGWLEQLANLQTLRFIALGHMANQKLSSLGIEVHHTMAHPQWWRRFQASHPDEFQQELREALT